MAKRPCRRPGCPNLVERGGHCEQCAPKHSARARVEASRPSAAKRGYDRAWQKLRTVYLQRNPLCAEFPSGVHQGRVVAATDLDHIIPHKGDMALFRDYNNLQGLCHECHSRKTATEDSQFANGKSIGGMNAAADRLKDGREY